MFLPQKTNGITVGKVRKSFIQYIKKFMPTEMTVTVPKILSKKFVAKTNTKKVKSIKVLKKAKNKKIFKLNQSQAQDL